MEMFRYLTGILEKEEKKIWKQLVVFSFISPILDTVCFSAIIYIINTIVREEQVSVRMTVFAFAMGLVSVLAGFFELYKCKVHNRLEFDGAHLLSVKIYELFIKEDLTYHRQKSAMQTLSMIRADTQNCIEIVIIGIRLWTDLLTIAGCSAVLIYAAGWVGVISCILLLIFMVGMYCRHRTQIRVYGEECRKDLIRTNAQVTVAYGIFKELKLSDRSETVLHRYEEVSSEYAQVQQQFKYRNSIIGMVMQNSVMSVLFLLLAVLMWRQGEELVRVLASMVFYITVFIRMIPLAYSVVDGMNNVEFNKKSYEVLRENLDRYDGSVRSGKDNIS